jgi:hypothetical protein
VAIHTRRRSHVVPMILAAERRRILRSLRDTHTRLLSGFIAGQWRILGFGRGKVMTNTIGAASLVHDFFHARCMPCIPR